jgi:hypothetical protein
MFSYIKYYLSVAKYENCKKAWLSRNWLVIFFVPQLIFVKSVCELQFQKNCEKLHVDIALTSFCRFRAIIFHYDNDVVLFSEDLDQGDQIGRIWAQWAIDYLVHFFHYRGSQKLWATFFLSIYALWKNLTNLGNILGDYFTNSSGHPDLDPRFMGLSSS